MKPAEIRQALSESNPQALLADGLDEALLGIARRCSQPTLAVYDVRKIIAILKKRDKMTTEEAWEFYEFNIVGSWVGENTPLFLER
jgi:hypothetical protein